MTENQADLPAGARCAVHADTPARVTCSRCGNFACEACETRAESGAILCKSCEGQDVGGVIPWEEREKLGVPRALVQTVVAVVTRPWDFFLARPREPSILPVVLFGWAIVIPSAVCGMIVNLLSSGSLEAQRAQLLANPLTRDMVWLVEPAFQLGVSLSTIVLYPLTILFYAVAWHVPLLMFAGAKQPFRETARAVGYLQSVNLPMLVILPVVLVLNLVHLETLGGVLAIPCLVYGYVWSGIAMWRVHRCDGWRVFAAVGAQIFGSFALCCLCSSLIAYALLQAMPLPGLR